MTLIGGFVGTYRVLALPFQDAFCELLVAEHEVPVLLLFCTGVVIETQADKDAFLQQANRSIQHNGNAIPLLKLGLADRHPYFVANYTEQIQQVLLDYTKMLSQALQTTHNQQPGDNRARFEALMGIIVPVTARQAKATASIADEPTELIRTTSGSASSHHNTSYFRPKSSSTPPIKPSQRLKRWQQGTIIAILLIILVISGLIIYTVLPASSATVTVTPVQKPLDQSYTLTVVQNTQNDPMSVVGRSIVFTSQQRTQTVAATGQGVHAATKGQGTIVLSQIQLNIISPTGNDLAISSVQDAQGRTIVTDEEVPIKNGGSVTIKAHAEPAGASSNIAAHDIDGPIAIVDAISRAQIGTGYISNDQDFSGGHDAINYTYVRQADIDNVVRTLGNQLLPGTKDRVKQGINKDEKPVQDTQCTSNSSPNHQANDEVGNLTVKLRVTCQTLVYSNKMLHDQAIKVYQSQGNTNFGSEYGIAGDMVVSQPNATQKNVFTISIKGIWCYQYTPDRIEALKRMISGHKSQDATQILQQRSDMQTVTLQTAGGFGNAVPNASQDIHIIINKVTGLQATATT